MSKEKIAIITGSTSGIGEGIAHAFAASGVHIMLNGFGDASEIEAKRQQMADTHGVKVGYHGADMTKPEQIRDLVRQTADEFGRVDILINNAGIQHTGPIESYPEEKWDAILAINLSSAFHTTKAVIPHMKKQGFGRIINIASVHGLVASIHKAPYVAAKHGIVGLTKVTALELAKDGITANAICPGFVHTPLVQKQIDDRAAEKGISESEAKDQLLGEKQPSGDFATVEQIGELALFLASDAAAPMTGACYTIDGGWTAQ